LFLLGLCVCFFFCSLLDCAADRDCDCDSSLKAQLANGQSIIYRRPATTIVLWRQRGDHLHTHLPTEVPCFHLFFVLLLNFFFFFGKPKSVQKPFCQIVCVCFLSLVVVTVSPIFRGYFDKIPKCPAIRRLLCETH